MFYLIDQQGTPLSCIVFPTEDDAFDFVAGRYGADAWNQTVILARFL